MATDFGSLESRWTSLVTIMASVPERSIVPGEHCEPNKRIESARCARPIRKGEALLLRLIRGVGH